MYSQLRSTNVSYAIKVLGSPHIYEITIEHIVEKNLTYVTPVESDSHNIPIYAHTCEFTLEKNHLVVTYVLRASLRR